MEWGEGPIPSRRLAWDLRRHLIWERADSITFRAPSSSAASASIAGRTRESNGGHFFSRREVREEEVRGVHRKREKRGFFEYGPFTFEVNPISPSTLVTISLTIYFDLSFFLFFLIQNSRAQWVEKTTRLCLQCQPQQLLVDRVRDTNICNNFIISFKFFRIQFFQL